MPSSPVCQHSTGSSLRRCRRRRRSVGLAVVGNRVRPSHRRHCCWRLANTPTVSQRPGRGCRHHRAKCGAGVRGRNRRQARWRIPACQFRFPLVVDGRLATAGPRHRPSWLCRAVVDRSNIRSRRTPALGREPRDDQPGGSEPGSCGVGSVPGWRILLANIVEQTGRCHQPVGWSNHRAVHSRRAPIDSGVARSAASCAQRHRGGRCLQADQCSCPAETDETIARSGVRTPSSPLSPGVWCGLPPFPPSSG